MTKKLTIVTGGAGFIGSNIVKRLNDLGYRNILVVDNLYEGCKVHNLADLKIVDYMDVLDFRKMIRKERLTAIVDTIFHMGACTNTVEGDGEYMMDYNYQCSKEVLHYCLNRGIRLVYASSASVYGHSENFRELPENERPLNIYAYSKKLFDDYVRNIDREGVKNVVGLRFFNVYGPREIHKKEMASMALKIYLDFNQFCRIKLFREDDMNKRYRDFIHVDNAVDVAIWAKESRNVCGIFNVGTGMPNTFLDVATGMCNRELEWDDGRISYSEMPGYLKPQYQHRTCADLTALMKAGYDGKMMSLKEGTEKYAKYLRENTK